MISEHRELLLIAALQELSRQRIPDGDEGRMAAIYDRYAAGKKIDQEDLAYVLSLASAVDRMKEVRHPVPEALQAAVNRYYEAEKRDQGQGKKETGSIVVRLGAGLELIASTLKGLEPVFVAVTPTRRAREATASRLTMNEALQGGGLIEYSIMRSTQDTVMISLLFQELKEPLTVRLFENDRPISSQTVRDATGRIYFDELSPGEYTIEMSGSMDRSFTLRLLGPSD